MGELLFLLLLYGVITIKYNALGRSQSYVENFPHFKDQTDRNDQKVILESPVSGYKQVFFFQ